MISGVYDDDLEDLLRRLGVYSSFASGNLACAFCREVLTWGNLYAVFPDSGAVKGTCARAECVKALAAKFGTPA